MNELELMTYRVLEKVSGYNITDDFEIGDDFVRDIIINMRSTVLKEFLAEKRYIPKEMYLEVLKLKVERSNPDETTTREYHVVLPSPLEAGIGKLDILYCGPNDEYNNLPRASLNGMYAWQFSEFGGKEMTYCVVGDRIKLVTSAQRGLKFLKVIGVFARPIIIEDVEYFPIPETLAVKLEMLVVKDILSTFNVRNDDNNNASDDTQNKVSVATPSQSQNGNSR